MKCPLQKIKTGTSREGMLVSFFECQGDKCAWWDMVHGCCSVLSISRTLTAAGNTLGKLVDKLTPELFRPR